MGSTSTIKAEVLDFSGPFEVFSIANRLANLDWNIWLVTEEESLVEARGVFQVKPHYSIQNVPELDVLVVVGGFIPKSYDRRK